MRKPEITEIVAARRIQRAWRNYQTRKVVKKYYMYYKHHMKKQSRVTGVLDQMHLAESTDKSSTGRN